MTDLSKDPALPALRRRAREVVLQVLYQDDLNPKLGPQVGEAFLRTALSLPTLAGLTRKVEENDEDAFYELPEVEADALNQPLREILTAQARRQLQREGRTPDEINALGSEELLAFSGGSLAELIEEHGFRFAERLLAGVRRNRPEIDQRISQVAANWRLERISPTDRNVLRLGAYELLYTNTYRGVVIDEAIELARRFGAEQSPPFVNGILDALARQADPSGPAQAAGDATDSTTQPGGEAKENR